MKILFLHGWHSTPGGVKPTYLREQGHAVLNPALPDDDFDAAVRIAQAEFDRHHPDVVVGSSRGGAVAMNIESGSTPLVLLCPAWKRWGTATAVKVGTIILHARADDIVPFADSEELVANSYSLLVALVEVGKDHRLADPESLAKMLETVKLLTVRLPRPSPLEAGVPRQFGVGTLLMITTMYAVLFGVLRALNAHPMVYVVVGLFFFAVGLGQMLLYKGRRPRRASIVVGMFICVGCGTVGIILESIRLGMPVISGFVLIVLVYCAVSGFIFGYLAGLLIAAVFLFADKLDQRIRWNKIGPKAK